MRNEKTSRRIRRNLVAATRDAVLGRTAASVRHGPVGKTPAPNGASADRPTTVPGMDPISRAIRTFRVN